MGCTSCFAAIEVGDGMKRPFRYPHNGQAFFILRAVETAVGSDIAAWLDAFDEGNLSQQGWRKWLFGLSLVRQTVAALRRGWMQKMRESQIATALIREQWLPSF